MDPDSKKDNTPNGVYVKHHKNVIRLVRISKMLQNATITIQKQSKHQNLITI